MAPGRRGARAGGVPCARRGAAAPGWQWRACGQPLCVRLGCPGRPERPRRLPKVFVQASHGSGAEKMAGLPNFGGAGEGREGRACCQPGPRLSADPGRLQTRLPGPKLFLRANFPVSKTRIAAAWTWKCPGGIPVRHPQAGRAGAEVATSGRPCWDQPSGQPRAQQRRPWRASGARARERVPPPAKFPAQCVAEAEAWSTPDLSPHSF